jgi:hypothetical protein
MATHMEHTASSRHMTLAEIEAFCRAARTAGATDSTTPTVRASLGGRIQRLGVTIEQADPEQP